VKSVRTKYDNDIYQPILEGIFNSIGHIVNAAVDAIDQMAQGPHQELKQISVLQVSIYLLSILPAQYVLIIDGNMFI